MRPVLVEVSSVVVANAHNPSILNHDWLLVNNVLPELPGGWEFAEPPFTTPPLSSIQYQNNVRIVLDALRLVITAQTLGGNVVVEPDGVVSQLATSYVSILKHIPYVAVGSNFKAYIECANAPRKLVDTFGGTGHWTDGLASLSIKLNHGIGDCERHLDVSSSTAQKSEENESKTVEVVLVSANYHREISDKDMALQAIGETSADLEDFMKFTTDFGMEIDV